MDINCLSQLCKIVKRVFSENGCGGILIGIRFGGGVIKQRTFFLLNATLSARREWDSYLKS